MPHLILASASPRRQQLLAQAGFDFEVKISQVDEWEDPGADPARLVEANARAKAKAISSLFPKSLVLAADTTVALDSEVFNKPADLDEARRMLRKLAGKTHSVFTAFVLQRQHPACQIEETTISKVTFKPLRDGDIEAYLAVAETLDKAGAYGIQEHGSLIIAGFEGSLSNIMGLPIEKISPFIKNLL